MTVEHHRPTALPLAGGLHRRVLARTASDKRPLGRALVGPQVVEAM